MIKSLAKAAILLSLSSYSNAQTAYIEYQDDTCEILIHVGCPKGDAGKNYLDGIAGIIKSDLQKIGYTTRLAFRESQSDYKCNNVNLNTEINSILELKLIGDKKACLGFYRRKPGEQMTQQDFSEVVDKLKEYSTITSEGKYICGYFGFKGVVAAIEGDMKQPLLQCTKKPIAAE